jgi:hypothetical protein
MPFVHILRCDDRHYGFLKLQKYLHPPIKKEIL